MTEAKTKTVHGVTVEEAKPTLVERLVAAKKDIGAVGKGEFNQAQKFNFRGIDAVLTAVAPALVKHGIVVYPTVIKAERGTATARSGGLINTYLITVDYTFTDGVDMLTTRVVGESFDSGDKGATKAMSVAYRIALIQALSLPTDEPDPDHDVYDAQPQVAQISDDDVLTKIMEATSADDLATLWAEQNVGTRPEHLRVALKEKGITLRAQEAKTQEEASA